MRNSRKTSRNSWRPVAKEMTKGIRSMRGCLFSHHETHEYYRCYRLEIFQRHYHVCSRCLGIYAGMLLGAGMSWVFAGFSEQYMYLATWFLPIPALVDWGFRYLQRTRGHNLTRTISGVLAGIAYAFGMALVIFYQYWRGLIPAVCYLILISAVIIYVRNKREAS